MGNVNMEEKLHYTRNYVQTSEVCPSRIVTSELGISQGTAVVIVEISIGSGPISKIHIHFKVHSKKRKLYYIGNVNGK